MLPPFLTRMSVHCPTIQVSLTMHNLTSPISKCGNSGVCF